MPYLIRDTSISKDIVGNKFEPKMPMDEKRPVTLGHELTQEQKDQIPRLLLVDKPKTAELPDVLGWALGPWIVSPRLRSKIESLETGVHEFIPIEVKQSDESRQFGVYYLILFTQALDAVVFEETHFATGLGLEAAKASNYFIDRRGPCTLYAKAISGRHLWRGTGKMQLSYFCSSELGDFIIREKIRGWDLQECQVKN